MNYLKIVGEKSEVSLEFSKDKKLFIEIVMGSDQWAQVVLTPEQTKTLISFLTLKIKL